MQPTEYNTAILIHGKMSSEEIGRFCRTNICVKLAQISGDVMAAIMEKHNINIFYYVICLWQINSRDLL